ncbi:MAG: site-specific DNA-methyltransferase [candidate division WOR-3 bacterium]
MNKIFLKSCEKMDEIQNNEVDLIVTSPPYWNAIDYDVHTADKRKWFRTRRGEEYERYLEWLEKCFRECYRVLKPGKFCCVVIGTILYKGKHYPLPYHFTILMEKIGYEFHQDIIWYKVTGGVKRAGVTIQNPYPGYYCPNIMTEYILIFKKPGPKIYQFRSKEEKEKEKIPIDELFTKELANNIWHIAPVPPNQYDHPCPFPEEIPYRLIKLFSYEGEIVLDPFLGIGTTTKVANNLGRRWVGYEIKEEYVKIAEKRISEPLFLREQLISVFEKIPLNGSSLARSIKVKPRKRSKKVDRKYILSSLKELPLFKEKRYGYKRQSKNK